NAATTGVLIGTVSYLAPELVTNSGADARSDVYAVGALLYEMLTGNRPHTGESAIQIAYQHVHADIPAPSRSVGQIPSYVDALVARATARDRDQRAADADVLLRQVRRVRQSLALGLAEDPELTRDLLPRSPAAASAGDGIDETIVVDPPAQTPAGDSAAGVSGTPADTAVWDVPSDTAPIPTTESASANQADPAGPPETRSRTRPTRRRRGPLLLVLVIILALLAGLGGWYYGIGRFDPAPDLEGMLLDRAEQRAQTAGYSLVVAGRAFSETIPKGKIISTDPGPGDRILPESTI